MPNLSGDRLAEELLAIRPEIPIILCTGFSERINEQHIQSLGIKGFLMKPIARKEIGFLVRKLLDEATESVPA
jgi:YesN/AraC family two-component response regulator